MQAWLLRVNLRKYTPTCWGFIDHNLSVKVPGLESRFWPTGICMVRMCYLRNWN